MILATTEYNIIIDDRKFFWISSGKCSRCKSTDTIILNADNSADEYGSYTLCQSCIFTAFEEYKERNTEAQRATPLPGLAQK